ncbi:MAG: hypothetical protein IRZ03_18375 [Acidobacterium ailaaui]|nr:hypothetical protein [Pseudacidobacterium ailaaui]
MSWIVPIAADPFGFDTRGTYPFTVADGSNTLQIRMNPSLVGGTLDSVIVEETSGFTVTMSGTFGCTYYYWDVPRGTPIPVADMSLVHELRQLHDTQNITAGQEKRYALQTGRTYLEAIATLVVAGQLDTTNVSNVRFIVDGNTPTMDESLMAYLTRIYNTYRRDFPPGTFIWDFQAKPWTPADYGSLELALALNSTAQTGTSPTYLDVFMRSLYQTSQILNDLATGVAG